jgi:hypothetical protein
MQYFSCGWFSTVTKLFRLANFPLAWMILVGGSILSPCLAQDTPPATQPAVQPPAQAGGQRRGMSFPIPAPAIQPKKSQEELDAALSKMLSGATLEGHFNTTKVGRDGAPAAPDRYTLGEVKKLTDNIWTFQYNFRGTVIPLPVPIQWAGNTPIVTIDEFSIMGMGPYTARVMFFEDHYSGYWKHGDVGGNMYGVIRRANSETKQTESAPPATSPAVPASESQATERPKQ